MNNTQIVWEKWTDPFGQDIEETKWNHYDDEELDEDTEFLEDHLQEHMNNKSVMVIASPLGIIPYNEYTASGKIFNFWIGHTNFNLSQKVSDIIEACPGVELLDIFTRYRFRIAIGKCFNDNEIMKIISDKIYEHIENYGS